LSLTTIKNIEEQLFSTTGKVSAVVKSAKLSSGDNSIEIDKATLDSGASHGSYLGSEAANKFPDVPRKGREGSRSSTVTRDSYL
jgi:hypothetical protein